MENWPITLPDVSRDYSQEIQSSAVRTGMESGRFRQRARFTTELRMIPVVWNMSQFQWALFQAFYKHKISFGADFFTVELPMGNNVLEAVSARMVEGKYSVEHVEDRYYIRTVLEVEEAPVMDEALLDFFNSEDQDLEALEVAVEDFHDLVHSYLPALF